MEFRFINGHWEQRPTGGQWATVSAESASLLAGFDGVRVVDGVTFFIDSTGELPQSTLQQLPALKARTGPTTAEQETAPGFTPGFSEEAKQQYLDNLYWWFGVTGPRREGEVTLEDILGEPFDVQLSDLGQVVQGPLDQEYIQQVRQEYLLGKFPGVELHPRDVDAARAIQTQEELGVEASRQGRRLFDESGEPIDQVQFTTPDGKSFTKTVPLPLEGTTSAPTVTDMPELGPNSVFVSFPDGSSRIMRREDAPVGLSLPEQAAQAFAVGDEVLFAKIHTILNQPKSLNEIIAQEFAKGTPEGLARAQEAFDFANQTTKGEAMQLALKFAESPADTLAWSALGRGEHRNVNLTRAGVPRTQPARDAFDAVQAEQQIAEVRAAVEPAPVQPPAAVAAPAANLPSGEGLGPIPDFAEPPRTGPIPRERQQAQLAGGFGPAADVPQANTRPDIEVAPQINQQAPTGLDAARVAATQAGAPGQAPAPEAIPAAGFRAQPTPEAPQTAEEALARFRLEPESGTAEGAALTGDPQFRPFGAIEGPTGEFEDIRVAPAVRDVATGRDVGRFDFNAAFREIGIAIGIGPNFRPPSLDQFSRLSPSEQGQLVGAAKLVGISEEEFFQAMGGATPGGAAQRTPRIGAVRARGTI